MENKWSLGGNSSLQLYNYLEAKLSYFINFLSLLNLWKNLLKWFHDIKKRLQPKDSLFSEFNQPVSCFVTCN